MQQETRVGVAARRPRAIVRSTEGLCGADGRRGFESQSLRWTVDGSHLIGVPCPEKGALQGGHWEQGRAQVGLGHAGDLRCARGGGRGHPGRSGGEYMLGSRGRCSGASQRSPALPCLTELVCNRTFDKYSCWPDTPPNTTANTSCPWYLPWHHKGNHRGDVGGGGGARAAGWVPTRAWPSSAAPPCLQEVWAGRAVGARARRAVVAQRFTVPDGRPRDRGPGEPAAGAAGAGGWGTGAGAPRPERTRHFAEGGGQAVQRLPGDVHGGVLALPGGPAPGLSHPAGPQVCPPTPARAPVAGRAAGRP